MKNSGAEIIIQSLKSEGVEFIFGYPGGAVLEIYDALFRLGFIRHILVRHEQAAIHAAEAYARVSGKVGVALVTSGPGATNAITGIADAYLDSTPIVVISGQVTTPAIGSDAFQEVDMVGITRPCVKHNFLITKIEDLIPTIKQAFYIAKTGRPGPVVVDVAKDVTQQLGNFCYPQEDPFIESYQPVTIGHKGQIKRAVKAIKQAKKPIIFFGGGVILSNASNELVNLVHLLDVPCVSTLMGLGAISAFDEHYLGMVGMHGLYEANLAMQDADLVIAIGTRFDDRVISVPEKFLANNKKIIHIDIDPSVISKRVTAHIPIVGDIKNVISDIIKVIKEANYQPNDFLFRWKEIIASWKKSNCLLYDQDTELILPQYVVETLSRLTNHNAIITSDVGQHQMFAAQYYSFTKPRQWLNSGGLGTMGVGLPFAMGAQVAAPKEQIFCITGDGSIQMNIQELSTCFQYRLPIKIINLNNGYLGMVRQWQEFYYYSRYSETYFDSLPDFVKLAESYGHVGIEIKKKQDVEPALKEAIKLKDRLVFMNFLIDDKQNVFPMVGNGKGLDEMVLPKHMRKIDSDYSVNSVEDKDYDKRSLP